MKPEHPSMDPNDPMPLLDQRAGFTSFDLTPSSRRIARFSRVLFGVFVVFLLGLAFLPWQQFVRGTGRVIAYDPLERSITVEAPLGGRLLRAHVVEGQAVKRDELLFELMDNDPNLLANLNLQREAALARRDAATQRVESLNAQLGEVQRALPLAVAAAETRLDAARFAATTARQQFERIQALYRDKRGLSSQRDFELALLERDRTAAELVRAEAELRRTEVDMRASMNNIQALRDAARADLAAAEQALVAIDVLFNQTKMQQVRSPRDGIVFRVQATEGTFLKASSPLCTIIPDTETRTVELWLSGNDMPLVRARETDADGNVIQEGSPVRLQFEGWPAIQFVGWPSVAVGTFGGEVILVDPTDNGKGKFRVLVTEKPDLIRRLRSVKGREYRVDWPGPRWLRQGVRANGWILLQRVPLWFELWRQMNGFPPALSAEMMTEEKK